MWAAGGAAGEEDGWAGGADEAGARLGGADPGDEGLVEAVGDVLPGDWCPGGIGRVRQASLRARRWLRPGSQAESQSYRKGTEAGARARRPGS